MGKVRVTKNVVHVLGRPLRPEEQSSQDVNFVTTNPDGPIVKDAWLETHDARSDLRGDQGIICLGVMPGDELGEIYLNVQFEGPIDRGHGEPDKCVEKQNDLLGSAHAWIAEILDQMGADFDAEMVSTPCPKATKRLNTVEATRLLERTTEVLVAVSTDVKSTVG